MNENFRIRVTLISVTATALDPVFQLVVDSSTGVCSFTDGAKKEILSGPSGLHSLQTHEAFDSQSASLEFLPGPMAQALADRILPNDFMSVEIQGTGKGVYKLAFLGLVGNITESIQSTPNGIKSGLVLQAQGLKKLFSQSIYNWQGALSLGDDVRLGSTANAAYLKLAADGFLKAPQELIKAFVEIGVSNAIQALFNGKRISPGGLFDFGAGSLWSSVYPATAFPNTAAKIMETCEGNLWSLLESLAEPDIHELFWTYGAGEGGQEKPILVHRPRPFPCQLLKTTSSTSVPASPAPGIPPITDVGLLPSGLLPHSPVPFTDMLAPVALAAKVTTDASHWLALRCHAIGKDGAPGATGIMRQRSDAGRVNAFHWSQAAFQSDNSPGDANEKLALGWWADKTGMAKYGFAPRPVSIALMPSKDIPFMALVASNLLRVASMEAPLYLLGNESRAYGVLLPGFHIGQALEDWSLPRRDASGTPQPTTGYIQSVSHVYRSTPQGITLSSTLGLSRCCRATFQNYPAAVLGLADLEHVDSNNTPGSPSHRATVGATTGQTQAKQAVNGGSGVPNAALIQSAAASSGVPAWVVAAVYGIESGCGTSRSMMLPNSSGALGPMQFRPIAVAQLGQIGYTNPDGSTFTYANCTDTNLSLSAGAALLANCASLISCPTDNPNYWGFVGMAYNGGPSSTALSSAQGAGWPASAMTSYGKKVMAGNATYGGLGS